MNTPIFQQVYRRMFFDKTFDQYDWIVKIDADTVLNVPTLRRVLKEHNPEDPQILGVGKVMRGAIMVVARSALDRYAADPQTCENMVDIRNIGEDWYLTYCMKFLGAPKIVDNALVVCLPSNEPLQCDDAHAAFHPVTDA